MDRRPHAGLVGRGLSILLVAVILSGCAAAGPTLSTSSAKNDSTKEPSWQDVAREFEVPPGDSFFAFTVNFTAPIDSPGGPSYCLYSDAPQVGNDSGVSFSMTDWHLLNGTHAQWAGTSTASGKAFSLTESCVGFVHPPQHPLSFLIIGTLSTGEGGPLRIYVPRNLTQKEGPNATIPGRLVAQGKAEVSYYLQRNAPGDVNYVRTHDIQVSNIGSPLDGAAWGGNIAIRTDHSDPGIWMESALASTTAPLDVSAGYAEASWTTPSGTNSTRTAFVGALGIGPAIPGFSASGPSTGRTSASLNVTGASTFSTIWFYHTSVPLDLSALGLDEAPDFGPFSQSIPPGGGAMCSHSELVVSCSQNSFGEN